VASWQDDDVLAVRKVITDDVTDAEIRELLDLFASRGVKKPVGLAIAYGRDGKLGPELGELRAKRAKAEGRRIIDQLEKMPPCDHGKAGGQYKHPLADRLWCVICDAEAKAAGIDVSTRSLSSSSTYQGDSGDSILSPSRIAPDQPESISGDSGDSVTARQLWTAAELLGQTFPRPRWAVENLIPEGVMLLAGAPKIGKSWLALGLCVAVASGGKALGSVDTVKGSALYLALEDTPRRLQARLRQVLGDDAPPDRLTLAIQWPLLPAGGADQLAEWLESHDDARLVVIDVFERIRGPQPNGTSAYTADYVAVRRVKELADRYNVAIILIHHMRKMTSGDFLNEVSGTLGLSGAADTIAVLKRSRGEFDGILSITGRDVEENEYAMKFANDLGAWQLMGPADDYNLADTRRQLLAYLRSRGDQGARPKETAEATGIDHDLTKKTLGRMADDQQVSTDGHGRYFSAVVGVPGVPET
jgi:hypothetical protein